MLCLRGFWIYSLVVVRVMSGTLDLDVPLDTLIERAKKQKQKEYKKKVAQRNKVVNKNTSSSTASPKPVSLFFRFLYGSRDGYLLVSLNLEEDSRYKTGSSQ